MTDFLANNTYLKTLYLTALLSTSLSTTIPSTKYTMVLSLKEKCRYHQGVLQLQ
jgi:hypothetical protein